MSSILWIILIVSTLSSNGAVESRRIPIEFGKGATRGSQDNFEKLMVELNKENSIELNYGLIGNIAAGVILDQKLYSISDLLYDNEIQEDGWRKITNPKGRIALYILCEVIYKEYEVPSENLLEVEFICPPPTDFIKLLYINRVAVGFYSVKCKGKLDFDTMSSYPMPTLDTIFIRESKRRQGLGSSALQDLLAEFPDQNIGFSYPISNPMKQVLKKHLEKEPLDRLRFWEITGCFGNQPDCRNLWLILDTHKHQ